VSWDLKIVGGTVVDGTGAAPREADVAVKDGRIVAIGACEGEAARVIDASGMLVTPGFVDIHTHYDGQATWDAEMAPSSWHGVTTCVMGNCGVGFAPVRPADHDRLVRLMEGVEDIPGAALAEGLPWTWESFPEYMEHLDRSPHTIDIAAQVPHDALRVYVMGDRAVSGEPATEADIDAMKVLLADALDAGAVGISTGRSDNHRTADGDPTPASEAARAELVGLAEVFAGRDRGVLQVVSDFDMAAGPERFDPEFDLLEDMASAAGGRPLSTSLLQRINDPSQWKRVLARVEAAVENGLNLRVQAAPRPIGVLLGMETTFHPFMGHPTFKAHAHLPLAERVAKLKEPAVRAQILSERPDAVAGDGSAIPPLADALLERINEAAFLMYRLTDPPVYEPPPEASLAAEAVRESKPALGVLYDALLEDEGEAMIYFAIFNYMTLSLDNVYSMITHPLALTSLSDGGAHVGTVCDASFPTTVLQWWARDRPGTKLTLEDAVYKLTGANAAYMGFDDRGVIAEGKLADLNVIDFEGLRLHKPSLAADLPAGGKRLLQRASGYRYTVKTGVVTFEDGVSTGAMPGKLVRL